MTLSVIFVKYYLLASNSLLSWVGVALLFIGGKMLYYLRRMVDIPGAVENFPISLIVSGIIATFVSLIGFYGVLKKNDYIIKLYSIVVTIIISVEVWIGASIFTNLDRLFHSIEEWLNEIFSLDKKEPFHFVELLFSCCGTDGASSYNSLPLPQTCCSSRTYFCSNTNSYEGCVTMFSLYVYTLRKAVCMVVIIVIAFQILTCLLASFFRNNMKREYGRKYKIS